MTKTPKDRLPVSQGTTYLYRLFDRSDVLLYVGITDDLGRRWKEHMKKKSWWKQVRRMSTDVYDTRDEAHRIEVAAIVAEYPVHNLADVPVERLLARDLTRLLRMGAVPTDGRMAEILRELGAALDDYVAGEIRRAVDAEEYLQMVERWQIAGRIGVKSCDPGLDGLLEHLESRPDAVIAPALRTLRARKAALVRHGAGNGDPRVAQADRAMALERVASAVQKLRKLDDDEGHPDPRQLRMRSIVQEHDLGIRVGRIAAQLATEGLITPRETVHKWLRGDEKLGLVQRGTPPSHRWTWLGAA